MREPKYIFAIVVILQISSYRQAHADAHVSGATETGDDDLIPHHVSRNAEFDWQIIQTVFESYDENTIISPFSVKLVLAYLLEAVAASDTRAFNEIKRVVFPAINSVIDARDYYAKVFQSLNTSPMLFAMKSKIYIQQDIQPQKRYLALLKTFYNDTQIERRNFNNTDELVKVINKWYDQVTDGNIPDFIQPSYITDVGMLIANALSFKGQWKYPFQLNQSLPLPFYKTPDSSSQTTFMTRTGKFYYYESSSLDARFLRLPYSGGKFALTVILPNTRGGLDLLVESLCATSYNDHKWLMEKRNVRVSIPKFDFTFESEYVKMLQNLGLRKLFGPETSLANFEPTKHFHMASMMQKIGIHIDETGTFSSGKGGRASGSSESPGRRGSFREFICDRPFMFTIEDEHTATILFSGKLTNVAFKAFENFY